VYGSNVIMAYVYFFWGQEKIKFIGKEEAQFLGVKSKIETDSYTLRVAVRDILLWCDAMDNGYEPPVRNDDEELEVLTEVTRAALFHKDSRPIKKITPIKLRKALRDELLSSLTEEELRENYPHLFSAARFLKLLRYWENQNDLPFTVRVEKYAGNAYRVWVTPKS
jgi:hypothetical protein